MTKLDKLLTTAVFAALLAGGLVVVPQVAFAQAQNPGAPMETKGTTPDAAKAAKLAAPKTGVSDAHNSKSYELLYPIQHGKDG